MDLDIRKAILHNIKENTQEELEATIVDAIQDGEEKLLPGLGYLFELIWAESDETTKVEMVNTLEKAIQHSSDQ